MTHKSHIEKLIQEMCPNGVNYMPLGEVCRSSMGEFVHKDKQNPNALYPVYNGGITNTGYYDHYNTIGPKVIISARGAAGFVNKVEGNFWAGNSCHVITIKDETILNWEYLYYALKTQEKEIIGHQQKGGGVPAVSKVMISELSIPIPPLPIQEEIVRILDAFANLIENIDNEIKERERQLESALNALFDRNISMKTLGELGEFYRGNGLQKKDFTARGIGCIHYGQIYTNFSTSTKETLTYVPEQLAKKLLKVHTGNLIIACTGENIEDLCKSVVWMGKEDIVIGGHSGVYRHNQDPMYIAYYFQSPLFAKQKVKYIIGAKVSDIKAENIAKITIPLPSLAEQRAIAEKLDTIEALIANLKTERDLRQQQYEYYREYLINLLK